MNTFSKPPLSVDSQIDQWIDRGLHVPDREQARHYLSVISYYRLSAYTLPFQVGNPQHHFRPGTSFGHVLDLYIFDRELRLLLLDAIERIEVAMLAGKSYQTVREVAAGLGITADDDALYTDTAYVRRLLAHYDIAAAPGETPFTAWAELPDCALLATKHHYEQERPFWHWVVFVREREGAVVLDPAPHLADNRRTDWQDMAVAWSIAVSSRQEKPPAT